MSFISPANAIARAFNLSKNRAARRKQALRLALMDTLENRLLLSTVDIGSGTLIYSDGGAASNVTISLASASVEQITDSTNVITLGPTAGILGWSGSGTHTVTGPTASFAFIEATGTSTAGANLTLNYASGDPLPTAGLLFTPTAAATGSSNRFFLQGGTFTSETYNGEASNIGNITYSDSGHTNTLINLININSVTDATPASSFTVNAPSSASAVNIISGTIGGSVIYQISDGGGTFPFINFDNKSIASLNANGSNATITMSPSAAAAGLSVLNINSTGSNNTINLQNTSSSVITDVNAANSTLNIGNAFGTLAGINGTIDISASGGGATININDANDTTHTTATLDSASGNVIFPFEVTGLSNASILYSTGVFALNLNTGISSASGGVTFNINDTQTGTTTTFNGGANQNTYNLSSGSETSGLQNLPGAVVVHGGGNLLDIVNLNDGDAISSNTYTVTGTTVSRPNFGGLTYSGIHSLTLDTENSGTGSGNTVAINGTANNVNTTINSFGNADTINLNSTGSNGNVALNTQTGGSTINLIACTSPVSVDMNASGFVNIGSTGGNGTITGIQAAVSLINGPNFYDFNLHDENDSTAQTWTLNDSDGGNTANIGLSSGSTISYRPGDLNVLNINAGSGGNTFNINQTSGEVTTTLNTGTGVDTVNVFSTGNGILNIDGQDGLDTDTLGGLANVGMQSLGGTINFSNPADFNDILLNNSQDTTGRTLSVSDDGTTGTITGLCPATIHYTDNDTNLVSVTTGSGDDSTTVNSNHINLILNDAGGNNTLSIDGQGLVPTVTAGSEPNEIILSASDTNGNRVLDSIDAQNYANVNLTDVAPTALVPGSLQTVTSVVHTGFINANVADFTLNLPAVGSGVPISDFSSSIAWGDGSADSAGTVTRDPNNPNHYFITGSHIFNAIGAFTDSNTVAFSASGSIVTSLNDVGITFPITPFSSAAGTNGTALSTTPNTSVFSPAPAKTATAGKLLKKFAIQLKTPQNKLDKTDNSSVTVSIASGPGSFAAGSTTTVNAVKGKATFSHLELTIAGTYTFTISNGEKTITSQSFTVTPSTVASLTISSPPISPNTTTALSFTVHAFDAFGNAVAKAPVKLSIASGPVKSKIVGTVSQNTAANGTATFGNLFLHTGGTYTLKAASKSVFIDTSSFNVGVL